MTPTLFHVFRNTPFGRENLLQSTYLCQRIGDLSLAVYPPQMTQAVMYLGGEVLTIDLDESYIRYQTTVNQHITELLADSGVRHYIFLPDKFTASTLPDLPSEWSIMTCPRVISDQSSRVGLGHIGAKVRRIIKTVPFPIFVPSLCFKKWTRITAFFGGSDLGLLSAKMALHLADRANVPFTLFTQLNGDTQRECEEQLKRAGLWDILQRPDREWTIFDTGSLQENLYHVPHDSLVVIGAAGHSLMHELTFGSKLELIQRILPNPAILVGPQCCETL